MIKEVTFDSSVRDFHDLTDATGLFSRAGSNFGGISKITGMNNLDTSNVTNMSEMFFGCEFASIGALNNVVKCLNTSKVENMSYMFSECNCSGALDLSNFNTSKVTNMTGMFQLADSLTCIDLSSFDTRNVTKMGSMFASQYGRNSRLTTILVSEKWSTEKVTEEGSDGIFAYCTALVGGNGTTYDDYFEEFGVGALEPRIEYAVIDGLNGRKGFLTNKYPKAAASRSSSQKMKFSIEDFLALFGTPESNMESNMESAIERPVEIQRERDTYKSSLPSKSVLAGSVTDKLYEFKAHEMSEMDSRNQQLLANAFVSQGQDNPIFAGKTPKLTAEFGIYPNRELTAEENGTKQVLTWNTFAAQTPGPVFAVCYNETDKAYVIYGSMDANGVAKLNDYILRSATNVSIYKLDI